MQAMLSELQDYMQAEKGASEGYSTRYLAEITGKGIQSVRALIRRGITNGSIEVTTGYEMAIDGKLRPVPKFKLKT